MSETTASPEKHRSLLEAKNVPALRRLAKTLKLTPYSKLRKDRLVTLILKVDGKDLARHLYVPWWRRHLGVVLSAIGIVLTLLLFALNLFLTPSAEKIVREVSAENKRALDAKFPQGHGVFGIAPDGFVVPQGQIPDAVEIFWETGKVINISETRVEIVFPTYIPHAGITVVATRTVLDREIGAKSGPTIRTGSVSPILEIIGIHGDLVIVALGLEDLSK